MKIGIIRETKVPEDNRVALSPRQIIALEQQYPNAKFIIQSSDTRCYDDDEYRTLNIPVVDNVSDCDLLFGIKEVSLETLIPNKHYFFFGHLAKKQEYNRPLLQRMMALGITFSDYEYLVDEQGVRVCAFGWWAGVVGVYNTLRAYGLKYNLYNLEKPDRNFTMDILLSRLRSLTLPPIKIVVTGNGRVSQGAVYTLSQIGIEQLSVDEYINCQSDKPCFCVATLNDLVAKNGSAYTTFDRQDFKANPQTYQSSFDRFYRVSDVMVSCHFWANGQPIYLTEEDLNSPQNKIRIISDITCDIKGSIKSTLRSSTHDAPFYDYNPTTQAEERAFSNERNITVMAVDTCPNALAIDTSRYFGEMLSEQVFSLLLSGNTAAPLIQRATILNNGNLTDHYSYLTEFSNEQ